MSNLPTNPSESTKRRNPKEYNWTREDEAAHLARKAVGSQFSVESEKHRTPAAVAALNLKPAKRLRQSSKGMNKLEAEFHHRLICQYGTPPRSQAVTFRLANGVRYTPDFLVRNDGEMILYEVKGPHAWDDSLVKIKVAAHEWPELVWFLVWKKDGQWKEQRILP